MDIEELSAMIPSETVREYVRDTDWTFTDLQKAVLLYQSELPLEEKRSHLKDLYGKTADEKLQKELKDCLSDDRTCHNEYLESAYIEVPNPFERGDMVRFIGTEDYGIVETSQKEWKEDYARYHSDEWKQTGIDRDFSDVQIRVAFLGDDGTFGHSHVNPICLERYQPQEDWIDGNPMDKLLLCASDLYRGKGSLDELYCFAAEYRKFKKKSKK